jgi:hypothetical protein
MANPPTGTTVPPTAPPFRGSNWGRTGEPGAAFIGLSKPSRGRGTGVRGARGTRGGRGRASGDPSNSTGPPPKVVHTPPKSKVSPSPVTPDPSTTPSKPPIASPTTPAKTKAASTRPPRNNIPPALVVDSSSLTSSAPSTAPVNPSPRTSSRRKRSQQQHPKPPASASGKLEVPDQHLSRPYRSHSGLASPSPLSKTIPPVKSASAGHAESTFDIRTDIDALVERVRAVAMAENRPTTPGSHIDWAGDEDDTLPDLNDWGVTAGSNSVEVDDGMSPLSVAGLRPLPDPTERLLPSKPPNGNEKSTSISVPATVQGSVPSDVPIHTNKPSIPSERKKPARAQVPRPLQLNDHKHTSGDPIKIPLASAPSDKSFDLEYTPANKPHTASLEHFKHPLHPSLPPKPVSAVENIITQPKSGTSAVPMRAPVSLKPTENNDPNVSLPATKVVAVEQPIVKPAEEPTPIPVSQPVPTPPSIVTPSTESVPEEKPRDEGLAASIHAPQVGPSESLSATNFTPSNLAPSPFNPTHARNHTLGRNHPPHSAPSHAFPHGYSRSGSSTPRGHPAYHARTHSTPPPSTFRAHHATRPVITGDAISRLARTIGNASVSPSRTAGVAASKQ